MRLLAAGCLLLIATACGRDPSGSTSPVFRRSEGSASHPLAVTITANNGRVKVLGDIVAPTACWDIRSRSRPDDAELVVRIEAYQERQGCITQLPAEYQYEVEFHGTKPGTYRLLVTYDGDVRNGTRPVTDTTVVMP